MVDNTVRMAALAEAMWGAGADMSSFIYLRLSGGVGGCVVSDFRLVGGAGGLAGELGHMTVGANDSPVRLRQARVPGDAGLRPGAV